MNRFTRLTVTDALLYDAAIERANRVYSAQTHNLFWNNCHNHVGTVLSEIKYRHVQYWGMVRVAWLIFWESKYHSTWDWWLVNGPLIILVVILILVIIL